MPPSKLAGRPTQLWLSNAVSGYVLRQAERSDQAQDVPGRVTRPRGLAQQSNSVRQLLREIAHHRGEEQARSHAVRNAVPGPNLLAHDMAEAAGRLTWQGEREPRRNLVLGAHIEIRR